MKATFDLVVIGGGTAGLVGAHVAAGAGARVAIVEADRTGGDCLWTGCVPSKRLLAAAHAAHTIRHADRHGLGSAPPTVDLAAVMARVRETQRAIEPHDSPERLRAAGVEVLHSIAHFIEPGVVDAGGRHLTARAVMVATGTRPRLPPIPGLAMADPLTTDNIWNLTTLPARLVVVGGGPSGCELGQAFARFGARVTIVEAEPRLLPGYPHEVSAVIDARLRSEGVEVLTSAQITAVADAQLIIANRPPVAFDRVLVCGGRSPTTEGLGLDAAQVATDARGFVIVDDQLRTSAHRVYAAGDITGVLPFTHVAAYQARTAVLNALFHLHRKVSYANVPRVVFTDPEVATVGAASGAIVQRFEYAHLDRALAGADAIGFAELVGDRRGRLIGATVVGSAAGEVIAEMTAWITTNAKISTISQTPHAYPTFAEGPSRAADDVLRTRFARPTVRRATRLALRVARRL